MTATFHDYWFGMPSDKRAKLADKIGTSVGYLEKVAGGFQLPSMHMATRMVRAARGLSYDAIVRTYEHKSGPIQ